MGVAAMGTKIQKNLELVKGRPTFFEKFAVFVNFFTKIDFFQKKFVFSAKIH